MFSYRQQRVALDRLEQTLDARFEYDTLGRIVGNGSDGRSPRFVLGRTRLGVLWRFRDDTPLDSVIEISRLMGREKGIPIEGDEPPKRPDRLALVERRLGEGRRARHEWIEADGLVCAEIWTVD